MKDKKLAGQIERFKSVLAKFGRLSSLRDPLAPIWEREGFQMTAVEVHMFMWLGLDGSLPMGELAARVRTTLANCTRTIDKLVKRKLVLRERDPKDRRSVLVRLSTKGRRFHRRIDEVANQHMGQFLEMLDEKDRVALLDILDRVAIRFSDRVTQEKSRSSEAT